MTDFNKIVARFATLGTVESVKALGNGLINDTYVVRTSEADAPDYVLQRINHHIFTDVDVLQGNIEAVTAHIRRKLQEAGTDDIDRKVLRFIPVKEGGKTYYHDGESYWRMMVFIPGAHTREGRLPKRICHCDTKVNNMMFDEQGRMLCVIDLDTVMPSYVFSDYGDFLRTGANKGDEDDRDLDRVEFDMDIFRAFTEGYLAGAGAFLTPVEIENLPYAAAMFPYMQAVRFLADYINGDTYYKIQYPEHNLVRTRAQLKLLHSVDSHTREMHEYIKSVAAG